MQSVDTLFERTNDELHGLRAEMSNLRVEMSMLRADVRGEVDALRLEVRGEIGALRLEMRDEMRGLRADFAALQDRLVQIGFGLAIALLGAVAALVIALAT